MKPTSLNRLSFVFFLGSVWGIAECLLGLYLRQCANLISGSVMTAVAILFLAASSQVSRNRLALPYNGYSSQLFQDV